MIKWMYSTAYVVDNNMFQAGLDVVDNMFQARLHKVRGSGLPLAFRKNLLDRY